MRALRSVAVSILLTACGRSGGEPATAANAAEDTTAHSAHEAYATAIRDDKRSYSTSTTDRGYVAARCAALYSEIAQSVASEQPDFALAKASDSHQFLQRLPNPPEDVFLTWSTEYRKLLPVESSSATTLWHNDYEACAGILGLIRSGDNMAKYTHDELRYLMGAPSKAPLK